MPKVLLIEDEPNVAAFILKGLKEEGYEVAVAYDGPTGLQLLAQESPDLVILDVILPGLNGLEVCQRIRQGPLSQVPILLLTALGTTDSVVQGLDQGADDYLVKPFKFKELLARLRALRRRQAPPATGHTLAIADLHLDRHTKTARRDGQEIGLTATEYRLLEYFLLHPRRVLSRAELLDNVWGINFDMGTNVVDVYVNYLRKKIDPPHLPKLLHTVIGMGYVLKSS